MPIVSHQASLFNKANQDLKGSRKLSEKNNGVFEELYIKYSQISLTLQSEGRST